MFEIPYNFPLTVDEFKLFFLREMGMIWQPYHTWTKTVWDTNDIAVLNHQFYKSLIDRNTTTPTTDSANWSVLSKIYTGGETYLAGDVVWDIPTQCYYQAIQNTAEPVSNRTYWRVLTSDAINTLYPDNRNWTAPIKYSAGDKAIDVVDFKIGVWESLISNNYYDPKNNTITPVPAQEPFVAWSLTDEDISDCILDSDIVKAMNEAVFKFNPELFTTTKGKMVALYLTAFFLVYDRQMAQSGVTSTSTAGPLTGSRVGDISVQYMQSTIFNKHPSYEFLSRNEYGIKAFNLMLPYLRGNVIVVRGGSTVD